MQFFQSLRLGSRETAKLKEGCGKREQLLGLGPRTLSTWNSKGKKEESVWEGEKVGKKAISCKIQPAYVGPGRVRNWKHDSALSVNIFPPLFPTVRVSG